MGDFARGRELFAIFAMRGRLDTRWFHSIQAQVNINVIGTCKHFLGGIVGELYAENTMLDHQQMFASR